MKGVEAGYGAVRALHGVSLDIGEGETVVLLGTNGNGKSTLMRCLMGAVRPTRGEITLEIDGRTVNLVGMPTEEIVSLGMALLPRDAGSSPSSPSRRTCSSARSGRSRGARSTRTSPSATSRSRC